MESSSLPSRQHTLSKRLDEAKSVQLRAEIARWDVARLESYASAPSGKWLEALPSTALATHLSNAQLKYAINQRLGSESRAADSFCPFCGQIMDAHGSHALSCMCGGDAVLVHNEGRNLLHRHAARGGTAPSLEPRGLLCNDSTAVGEDLRPADVPVGGEFAAHVGTPHSQVAINFGISNALSPLNFEASSLDGTSAAKAYANHKRTRHATAEMCEAAGIRYLPIVYTSQGGVDPDAAKALRILHRQVADFQGTTYQKVKERFDIEMEMVLLKGAHRADRRRQDNHVVPRGMVRCLSSLDAATILEPISEAMRL